MRLRFKTMVEQVIAGILVGFCTYLFLMPFIHESGHALFAHWCGWNILEMHVSIPALVTPSYVIISAPIGANLTFFYMAGSWSCILWGFLISFFPILIRDHWLWLSIGYGLMSDGIVYPIWSHIFGYGDWVEIDPICSIFTVGMTIMLIFMSVLINKITKWRLRQC